MYHAMRTSFHLGLMSLSLLASMPHPLLSQNNFKKNTPKFPPKPCCPTEERRFNAKHHSLIITIDALPIHVPAFFHSSDLNVMNFFSLALSIREFPSDRVRRCCAAAEDLFLGVIVLVLVVSLSVTLISPRIDQLISIRFHATSILMT